MPATATPRKPQTLARKLVETRNTSRNRGLAAMLGLGESEKELARDFGSGLNDVIGRGTLASLIGLPGDLGGLAENGIRSALGMPQVQPYGGSEHIGQKLEEAGLVSPVRRPKTELLASLISPSQAASAAYRAPQMARAGVRMLDNLAAPRTMGSQTGAIRNIFHGTTPEAAAAIEREGFDLSKSADGSIWFTSNPNIGEVAASGKGGIVKRALDDEVLRLGGWDEADKYGVDELLQQGYDGLKLDDGEEAVYQIFNPEKLMPQQPVGNLGKMVAPQDEALRVAQQNAAKPIEEGGLGLRPDNTPEERAAAMGFRESGYHGSASDITNYDGSRGIGGASGSREGALGAWLTDDPNVASSFAAWSSRGQGGDVVYPMMIRGDNPLEVGSYGEIRDLIDRNTKFTRPPYRMVTDRVDYDAARAELANHDFIALRNTMTDSVDGNPITQYVVPDTSRLRSRFAAFDPMRRDSSDILAGLAPLGLGAWMYQDEPVK